jgi:selenide,water dikinase
MMQRHPITRDLVLIGGGHTHALVLRMWGMNPLAGVRLTVIDPSSIVAYSGMLPGFVAGHYSHDALAIDLVRLARFAGARLITAAATGIDLAARTVIVPGRPPVGFDVASIDIGITSDMPAISGFSAHAVPVKPLTPFARAWETFEKDTPIAVIGGGVAGAEIAMAMAHRTQTPVHLIEAKRALSNLSRSARTRTINAMKALNISLHEHAPVTAITAGQVHLATGETISASFICGTAGARAHDWPATTGLVTENGFLAVNRWLQTSDAAIFATGDCAHMSATPRPKAGVFAVRQAPVLFHNLRATLAGGPLRPFAPQADYLKLISLGSQSALAEKWGLAFAAPALWRWKDRIDRRFMDKLNQLPAMSAARPPHRAALGLHEMMAEAPMCGGCGAKVGRSILADALATLPPTDKDIDRLPGDDAALLRMGTTRQVITTDHLRAVTEDPVLMTRIAAIHALGDIWAMAATPQAALVTLILPRMSSALQARTMDEIMATAADTLSAAGATIVGGHTSQGDELTIGFTLTGLLDRNPITLGGGQAGDALILTKPIGSGTILAAEMRSLAPGADVTACHAAMVQPQATSARILSHAHAMTDVTGFGLAGHLANICVASGLTADVALTAVPLLQGARSLASKGIRSTLYPQNRAASGPVFGAQGPLGDLMFDPQTCGGLLAAIPPDSADMTLAALRDAGYSAAIIGHLTTGSPAVTFR